MTSPPDNRAPAVGGGGDWTVQAADTVERIVGTIRDKTTVPLTTVARALVFGLMAAVMGVAALVLVAVGAVRALDAYVPPPTGDRAWVAHLIVGGIFCLVGGFLLRAAGARSEE